MKAEIWKRINPRDGDEGSTIAIEQIFYGLKGEQYPRLLMMLHAQPRREGEQIKGVDISCARKNSEGMGGYGVEIPVALVQEAVWMLERFIASRAFRRNDRGPIRSR